MRNFKLFISVLFVFLFFFITYSCTKDNSANISEESLNYNSIQKRTYYDDYSDDSTYTLSQFIGLNHDVNGLNFIAEHIDSIIDNGTGIHEDTVKNVNDVAAKVKFKFRHNGCNPLGACIIRTFRNAGSDEDMTVSHVGIVDNKIIVIPQGIKNGMLSDGYIFVDPISIGNDEADLLGVPHGSSIKPGIYKSKTPNGQFPYGYHIFNLN
jgi:hypothetical protein